jgi:hypothetical protein
MSARACRWVASFVVCVSVLYLGLAYPLPAIAGQPQRSDVYDESDTVVGTSQLVRTANGVAMNLRTTGLDPGAAHTVWWVIFNNPEFCADGCGPDDLGNSNVLATVLWATGHVIGNNGVGDFAAHLTVEDTSGDSFPIDFPGDVVGLINPLGAVIHLVVRTHGSPIPGQVKEQISTYNGGGCTDFSPPNFDDNPNDACRDYQFAVHEPQ